MVLVHGTPFSSFVWRKIAPILSEARSVYWYDLLGYGRSAMQDGQDVSLGVQNRLLAALLDHWGLARPDIVAHDFGGATALRAHLLDRCDYRSLALIDSVAIAPWGSPFVQHVRRHEAAFAGVPPYVHAAIVGAYIRGAAATQLPGGYAGRLCRAMARRRRAGGVLQADRPDGPAFHGRDRPSFIGAVRCPTLILWGERDEWLPIERGRTLAGLIPGAISPADRRCGPPRPGGRARSRRRRHRRLPRRRDKPAGLTSAGSAAPAGKRFSSKAGDKEGEISSQTLKILVVGGVSMIFSWRGPAIIAVAGAFFLIPPFGYILIFHRPPHAGDPSPRGLECHWPPLHLSLCLRPPRHGASHRSIFW